jgi:hypothetical protein
MRLLGQQPTTRLIRYLILIAGSMPIVVLGVYAFAFRGRGISSDPENWARFGEYIGGSLGAFYGFLAFIGVLVTIVIQQSQSKVDELQRLMASVAQRIDEIFDSEPKIIEADVRQRMDRSGSMLTVFTALSALGIAALVPSAMSNPGNRDMLLQRGRIQIGNDAPNLCIELQHLVGLLKQYTDAGGSDAVTGFYVGKYAVPVAWLQAIGLLSSEIVEQYFSANRYAQDMRRRYGGSRETEPPPGGPAMSDRQGFR